MVDTELLAAVQLFADFPPEGLAEVAAAAQQRQLDRNDVLFNEQDEATELFVVLSGRIAIANVAMDGRESVVALMEDGDVFGEMPLFDGRGRSAAARVLEPSEIVAVPYEAVRTVYETDPSLLWTVVALLAGRIRVTDEALADAMFLDVTGRTAKRLLDLAGDDDEFELPVTQEELAGMVGASRERVNKAISSFLRLGWLEQNDGRYRITNRQQMEIRAS
ncbi:MAG TPA: Crp/Fnr family transcriptional regulator [Acidimicrobiales bacterium]|nr:Crp/Fnr family transcriptional regulator [Acidimicrobiales bacterium]